MFFEEERLPIVRQMILAATRPPPPRTGADAERSTDDREAIVTLRRALSELEPLQTDDFNGMFRAMDGLPVVIRLHRPAAARVPAERTRSCWSR